MKTRIMSLKNWKKKGIYFDYKSYQIFTVDEGSGDVLLLIHGFPTSSWDWSQMWDPLTKSHRVLALDMIGFGYSDKPRRYKYSICLLYTSPSPRDRQKSRMPSSA